ncbi:uncharacterized protein AMSG_06436 [Thecamonas trahens ATCC 50062]|uniref:CCHC-type domain-containing protein n=1 Tax=Thecamonas trahens ATCC 50062 TaxID=461836 RepID=A0A0L0DD57_THETB|nr:hypothetical protein AMSG_06436 [Thecamonas trahens ATCC 50062]KNC50277.1 hypothetical protein AMSG_06436 [Thecamonas trahens ATCC 50062]|eukprot:XP_013757104.1 hypothetical protein AMSG_06436 [Thecamonas trahens ATCC 50062]
MARPVGAGTGGSSGAWNTYIEDEDGSLYAPAGGDDGGGKVAGKSTGKGRSSRASGSSSGGGGRRRHYDPHAGGLILPSSSSMHFDARAVLGVVPLHEIPSRARSSARVPLLECTRCSGWGHLEPHCPEAVRKPTDPPLLVLSSATTAKFAAKHAPPPAAPARTSSAASASSHSRSRRERGGGGSTGGAGAGSGDRDRSRSRDQRGSRDSSRAPVPGVDGAVDFNGVCFICNKPGHRARQCTQRAAGKSSDHGACFRCGQQGHYARECPDS